MDAENAVGGGNRAVWWRNLALVMELRYSLCLFFPLFFRKYTAKNVLNFFPFLNIRTVYFILGIFFSPGFNGRMDLGVFGFWLLKVPEFPNGHIFFKCFPNLFKDVSKFIWNRRGLA